MYGFRKPEEEEELVVTCQAGGRVVRSLPVFESNGCINTCSGRSKSAPPT